MKMPTKPREGSRELDAEEVTDLRRLHKQLTRLRYKPGQQRNAARQYLLDALLRLYDDGVPVTHLGAAMNVSGQRAQQLVAEARGEQ